jgi:hypothetical protein
VTYNDRVTIEMIVIMFNIYEHECSDNIVLINIYDFVGIFVDTDYTYSQCFSTLFKKLKAKKDEKNII